MREMKFRGIAFLEQGSSCPDKWVYGNLIKADNGDTFIVQWNYLKGTGYTTIIWQVKPETVGQYTALKDKNDKEIYEGDLLRVFEVSNTKSLEYVSPVEFIESGFLVTEPNGCQVPLAVFHNLETSYPLFEIEVIGNIHVNPQLLRRAFHDSY